MSVVPVLFFLYLCVSGTVECVINVRIWHECSVNISKTICNPFKMHFRMLSYVEKPLQRVKHLITVT